MQEIQKWFGQTGLDFIGFLYYKGLVEIIPSN
jgi:hypothetical protein